MWEIRRQRRFPSTPQARIQVFAQFWTICILAYTRTKEDLKLWSEELPKIHTSAEPVSRLAVRLKWANRQMVAKEKPERTTYRFVWKPFEVA